MSEPLDFDLFWQERVADKPIGYPVKLFGAVEFLNTDIPFADLQALQKLQVTDLDGMVCFVDKLYGVGAFTRWIDAGMTVNQLPIILGWSMATIQGRKLTFTEVAKEVEDIISSGKVQTLLNGTGAPLKQTSNNTTA